MPVLLVERLKQVLRRVAGKPQPAQAIVQHPFDLQHGVDTSGLLEARSLRTGHANDAENTAYFGVPPSRFRNALEAWRTTPGTLPLEQYRFIDVGCGKGRAVLLASGLPFHDVIGIELHAGLAAVARANVAHWRQTRAAANVSIVVADAPTALRDVLNGPVLLYVYNPFRAAVLRQLLRTIQVADLSAPVEILYLYPEHDLVFDEFQRFEKVWHRQIPIEPQDAVDGISSTLDPCSLYRYLPAARS